MGLARGARGSGPGAPEKQAPGVLESGGRLGRATCREVVFLQPKWIPVTVKALLRPRRSPAKRWTQKGQSWWELTEPKEQPTEEPTEEPKEEPKKESEETDFSGNPTAMGSGGATLLAREGTADDRGAFPDAADTDAAPAPPDGPDWGSEHTPPSPATHCSACTEYVDHVSEITDDEQAPKREDEQAPSPSGPPTADYHASSSSGEWKYQRPTPTWSHGRGRSWKLTTEQRKELRIEQVDAHIHDVPWQERGPRGADAPLFWRGQPKRSGAYGGKPRYAKRGGKHQGYYARLYKEGRLVPGKDGARVGKAGEAWEAKGDGGKARGRGGGAKGDGGKARGRGGGAKSDGGKRW